MTSTPAGKPPADLRKESAEEPEITQEESVPSDGKDKDVEKEMEKLGRERKENG